MKDSRSNFLIEWPEMKILYDTDDLSDLWIVPSLSLPKKLFAQSSLGSHPTELLNRCLIHNEGAATIGLEFTYTLAAKISWLQGSGPTASLKP